MTELEKHRKTWQGKSDEWLFERLALELKDKVETIHNLLAENEQLRIANVVGRSEQYFCCKDKIGQKCSEQCLGCYQYENYEG